jgi:hypothetical protein
MKKTLLLAASLILCFGVVNAQKKDVSKMLKPVKGIEQTTQQLQKRAVGKVVSKPYRLVLNTKDPVPSGYARISVTVGDV